jgi:hypothetical protein
MKAASRAGATLFRNNVGVARFPDGSAVRYGLHVGSSDLIGFTPVVITADMIGNQLAVFTAIEVKTSTGRLTVEQQHFIDVVRSAGGIAGVARSEAEAITLLQSTSMSGNKSGK